MERPAKELRGFEKVFVPAGQSKDVAISLPLRSFTRFDEASHSWVVDPGTYNVLVGSSSEDIRCSLSLEIK